MSLPMAFATLVSDLKATLHDSAAVFRAEGDADFKRFLLAALPDMQAKRPITRLGEISLFVEQARYAVTYPDFAGLKVPLWSDAGKLPQPWEPAYPGPIPRLAALWDGAAWWLEFETAPNWRHLACLGDKCRFWYFGSHVLSEDGETTTIAPADRGLLLLRAQAEAMRELAVRNAGKPVQLRDGFTGWSRNSTPAALHKDLLDAFWSAR